MDKSINQKFRPVVVARWSVIDKLTQGFDRLTPIFRSVVSHTSQYLE